MKTLQKLLLISALLLSSPMAVAQDLLDALKQTAEMHNDSNSNSQQENGEESQVPSDGQNEFQRQWEEMMNKSGEFLSSLDSKYLKCMALMEMYVYMYLKLVNEHKLGDIGMSACDALGMQTLAMAASSTIMYCPEGMKTPELNDDQRTLLALEYRSLAYMKEPYYSIHSYLESTYLNWASSSGLDPGYDDVTFHNYIVYLMEFFRPRYIISQTLKIAQEMEAMGCSG